MNERQQSGSGNERVNDRDWVLVSALTPEPNYSVNWYITEPPDHRDGIEYKHFRMNKLLGHLLTHETGGQFLRGVTRGSRLALKAGMLFAG